MNAVWAQDFDFMTQGGGAQLTDRTHFEEGLKRGHNLRIWSPSTGEGAGDIEKDEVVIASNPVFLGVEVFQRLIEIGISCIWLLHDYMPLCKYRLFYPMRESCRSCYLKERWISILQRSKLIIWLSPLHRDSWLWLAPELAQVPFHLAPSPVKESQFSDLSLPRKGVIAVESLHPFKGRKHVLKWAVEHPEVEITLVGGNPSSTEPLPPNCKDVGSVPYSKMNELYNLHEYFLHLPQSPSPFDRCVAEAYLAGCKVIGNSLVGALSYKWFTSKEEVAKHCQDSSRKFWEAIEGVLGG